MGLHVARPVIDRYNLTKKLIRMSWSKYNLYNMATKEREKESSNLRKSVFQQRWAAKKQLRAYYVPNISERQFIDRHFTTKIKLQHLSKEDQKKVPPAQTLAFAELERRIDVVVFRSHFQDSIFNARRIVRAGHVKVNGVKCNIPCRSLKDGDMITVDPAAVVTLKPPRKRKEILKDGSPNPYPETPRSKERRFVPQKYMAPWMFVPEYLEVNYPTCSTVFLRSPLPQPSRVEIPSPLDPTTHQLGFEWYATIKRRKTRKTIWSPMVINGKTCRLKPKFDQMLRNDQFVKRMAVQGKKVNLRRVKVKYTPRFVRKVVSKNKDLK
ncbi:mitochondrial 37S ribosomal protein nam9 [Clydaea vesicula]|uniref:Mitochondrial 37S ribosomal protein nam9 n=1 Tax=Clydaea vesicula TaxID=447962 RepID=A0AAD5U3X9_9FUNG|nr:mitochondrial 37S ribosomal protein nam9 [Clydaea vesicula]KAJ3390882.1 mitochondrial 37S ribosomal protein nam9 [Lobulomyces angularis]